MQISDFVRMAKDHPGAMAGAGAAAALGALAAYNTSQAREAERENPPIGRFVEVEGVRLHYYARGEGRPLVLLHGNGTSLLDFLISGFLQQVAERYRVIAFDRPGFGFSDRPRSTIWSGRAQARLLLRALDLLGIEQPIVLGHSWGSSVALAMGLMAPERICALVLLSGYYFPTTRLDAPAFSGPAVPLLGDVTRFTIDPVISRLVWPKLVARMFAPQPVPERFQAYPKEMSLRPSQLRAAAAESALMVPDAMAMQDEYASLRTPLTVVGGDADQIIHFFRQSMRLHREIPHSQLVRVSGVGHMVHYFAATRILRAIEAGGAPLHRAVNAGALSPEPTPM